MHQVQEKECRRCGKCCGTSMFAYVTEDDLNRWKKEHRQDLIDIAENGETIWAGDRIMTSTGEYFRECQFLKRTKDGCTCIIYETRPGVCASYSPGSSPLCPEWDGY
jgi:Fe-S-cluster containining protein